MPTHPSWETVSLPPAKEQICDLMIAGYLPLGTISPKDDGIELPIGEVVFPDPLCTPGSKEWVSSLCAKIAEAIPGILVTSVVDVELINVDESAIPGADTEVREVTDSFIFFAR